MPAALLAVLGAAAELVGGILTAIAAIRSVIWVWGLIKKAK